MAILGEAARDIDTHALFDIEQDLLIAGLIADEEQPEAVVLQDLESLSRNVRFRVARPDDADLAELLRQRLDAWEIVGERVVVEEEFLDLRKGGLRPFHFFDDVLDG